MRSLAIAQIWVLACRSPLKVLRRLGYAAFGVFNGTEVNPSFVEDCVRHMEASGKGCILYCGLGASEEALEANKKSLQSR